MRLAAVGLLTLSIVPTRAMAIEDRNLHAPWVSCYDNTGEHFIGAKFVRTPVLASTDGRLRAYAEIRAALSGKNDCGNTAVLFISGQDSKPRAVFTQKPDINEGGTAGSLGPIGWSSDSRWLLVEQGLWWYASDSGGLGVLVYDAREDRVSAPDVLGAIAHKFDKGCSLDVVSIIGFDRQDRIIVRVSDAHSDEEVDTQTQSPCITMPGGTADWLYDLKSNEALPSPGK